MFHRSVRCQGLVLVLFFFSLYFHPHSMSFYPEKTCTESILCIGICYFLSRGKSDFFTISTWKEIVDVCMQGVQSLERKKCHKLHCIKKLFRAQQQCSLLSVTLFFSILQEATEEELEKLLDRIMVLFRFIHGMYNQYVHCNVFLQCHY